MSKEDLIAVVEKFVINESKAIFNLLSISEKLERDGLKSISRYIKATAYSKQTIIIRFYRNLKISGDDVNAIKENYESYMEESKEHLKKIDFIAKEHDHAGCSQTVFFATEIRKHEKTELEKVFNSMTAKRDIIYANIYVCPLCGLVITDDKERCPLCGANKAIFKSF